MSDQQSAAPVVAHTREEFKAAREALSSRDVAVVMTMGALHDGHARLIQAARQRHDHVVVTIFLWVRASFPRFRYDQIMRLGWKIFIPVTLIWLLLVGGLMQTPWNIWK